LETRYGTKYSAQKYNSVKVRNDWNGEVIYHVDRLGELRDLFIDLMVTFDSTGGDKVVSNEKKMSVDGEEPFFYYIEQEDRSAGIQVRVLGTSPAPTSGAKASVKGVVGKDAAGNIYIDTTLIGYCNLTPGGPIVAPLSLTNKAVAGGESTGGAGTPNAGLLATVWGKVSDKAIDEDTGTISFNLDDGSTASDGSALLVKVYDYAFDGLMTVQPVDGQYWKATGIITLELQAGNIIRTLVVDGKNAQLTVP
jgi:hypothetical protein